MVRGREEDSRQAKPEHLCLSPVEAGGAELLNLTPASFIFFKEYHHRQSHQRPKHSRHHSSTIIISRIRGRAPSSSSIHRAAEPKTLLFCISY